MDDPLGRRHDRHAYGQSQFGDARLRRPDQLDVNENDHCVSQLDGTGTYSSNPQAVTVTPATTLLAISGGATAVEGSSYTLNLAQMLGPSVTGWTINWGDGNTTTAAAGDTTAQYAYSGIPTAGATFQVTAIGVNANGSYQSNTLTVTASAAAPSIAIIGPASIDGGAIYTLNLSATEFAGHTVSQWDINWGDGSPDTIATPDTTSVSHVFQNPSTATPYTISATVTDDTGTHSSNPLSVTVNPAATVLSISGNSQVGAGVAYTLSLSQAGGPALSGWTINWGDGTSGTLAGTATTAQHTFSKGALAGSASYQISASGTNTNGVYTTNSVALSVNPVAPTVTISGPSAIEGTAVYTLSLSGVETDGDQLSGWNVNWGDNSSTMLAGGATSAIHVYANPSSTTLYTISATASDLDGSYGSNTQNVTVVPAATAAIDLRPVDGHRGQRTYTLSLAQTAGTGRHQLVDRLGRRHDQHGVGHRHDGDPHVHQQFRRRDSQLYDHCHGH